MVEQEVLEGRFQLMGDVFDFIEGLGFELILVLAINVSIPVSENHAKFCLQLFLILAQLKGSGARHKLKILRQPQTKVFHFSIRVLAVKSNFFMFVNFSVTQFVHFVFEGSRQRQQLHFAKLLPKRLHNFLNLFLLQWPRWVAELADRLL